MDILSVTVASAQYDVAERRLVRTTEGHALGLNATRDGALARIAAATSPGAVRLRELRLARIMPPEDLALFAPTNVSGPAGAETFRGFAYAIEPVTVGD